MKVGRDVTDEQRGRRPIFNTTLRAGAGWLFFRVARSTRMTQIWALRSRLEKQPTDRRRRHHYLRDGALVSDLVHKPNPQKSHALRIDELIAGWKSLRQTLRVYPRAGFEINESKMCFKLFFPKSSSPESFRGCCHSLHRSQISKDL